MARIICLTLLLGLHLSASDAAGSLMEADRRFDRDTASRGLDGWMANFADDAQLNTHKGVVKGTAALREHYKAMFAQKDFSIRWKPTFAEASQDGTLGYTFGEAEIKWTSPEGKPQSRPGRYVTIWRKQPDGVWKVVTDIGN